MLRIKDQGRNNRSSLLGEIRTKEEPRMNLRTPKYKMCVLLRLPSFFPLLYLASFYRPMSGRKPREERINFLSQKVLFLNIAFLKQLTAFLKKLSPFLKRLTRILKLLPIFLKRFTPFLKRFTPCCAFCTHLLFRFTPNKHKKCTFPQKKCIFLHILTSFSSLTHYLCTRIHKNRMFNS